MMTDTDVPNIYVIIPAAGSGTRLKDSIPKQYRRLGNKTVLDHVLDIFSKVEGVAGICVSISQEHTDLFQETWAKTQNPSNITKIFGGETRKESVYNALQSFSNLKNEDIIVIHDAARPFVRADEIEAVIAEAQQSGAATLATPLSATLHDVRTNETVDRTDKWAIQTPQAFKAETILKAHETFKDDTHFTDDASLVRALGHEVTLISSGRHNFKITTQADFDMAQTLIQARLRTLTTMGYDIHAFDASGDFVTLGGIQIPHTKSLCGHSDADVILHALTDSILGAIGQGDIGTHFPPSDPQWKDADSALFLAHALDLLTKAGGILRHIDISLQCESPKIGPHRDKMIARLSELTSLPTRSIGLKATTLEKLGALGREEGIAAHVLTTIDLPA